jgi:hypothetical protein
MLKHRCFTRIILNQVHNHLATIAPTSSLLTWSFNASAPKVELFLHRIIVPATLDRERAQNLVDLLNLRWRQLDVRAAQVLQRTFLL